MFAQPAPTTMEPEKLSCHDHTHVEPPCAAAAESHLASIRCDEAQQSPGRRARVVMTLRVSAAAQDGMLATTVGFHHPPPSQRSTPNRHRQVRAGPRPPQPPFSPACELGLPSLVWVLDHRNSQRTASRCQVVGGPLRRWVPRRSGRVLAALDANARGSRARCPGGWARGGLHVNGMRDDDGHGDDACPWTATPRGRAGDGGGS